MQIFGVSLDAVLIVGFLVVWFVLMKFILPRMGVST
jgi:hypothetical protein